MVCCFCCRKVKIIGSAVIPCWSCFRALCAGHQWTAENFLQEKLDNPKQINHKRYDQLMDKFEFESSTFQRPYQYLRRSMTNGNLNDVDAAHVEGNELDMLNCLLAFCGIQDPSWAELRHFVWFLNTQLEDTERSVFCLPLFQEDLPNFRQFVVQFMIQMSKVQF